ACPSLSRNPAMPALFSAQSLNQSSRDVVRIVIVAELLGLDRGIEPHFEKHELHDRNNFGARSPPCPALLCAAAKFNTVRKVIVLANVHRNFVRSLRGLFAYADRRAPRRVIGQIRRQNTQGIRPPRSRGSPNSKRIDSIVRGTGSVQMIGSHGCKAKG